MMMIEVCVYYDDRSRCVLSVVGVCCSCRFFFVFLFVQVCLCSGVVPR
jgi:hypothetical protein